MARIIQEQLKKPLAEEILFGKLSQGGRFMVDAIDNKISLKIKESAKISTSTIED